MVCKPVELSRVVEWLADRRRSRCIIVETEANERTPPVKTEEHSMTKTLVVERSRELTFFIVNQMLRCNAGPSREDDEGAASHSSSRYACEAVSNAHL